MADNIDYYSENYIWYLVYQVSNTANGHYKMLKALNNRIPKLSA